MKFRILLILLLFAVLTTGCTYRATMLDAGERNLAKGNLEKAREIMDEVLKYYPHDAKAHLYRGFLYLYEDDMPNATKSFEASLKYNKKPDLEFLGLGQVYLILGDYKKSREYLEKAQSIEDYPVTDYLLGFIYLEQGEMTESRAALKKATSFYPDRGEVWAALGKLSLERLHTLDAVQAYQMAYVYGIRNYDLYAGLGEAYFRLGNFRQAIAVTERALQEETLTQKEKEQLHVKLAQFNANQNPWKAISSFETILQKNPDKPEVLLMLGQLYYQQNEYKKTAELYQRFLAKYQPMAPVLHMLYNCQVALGNTKLAEKYLRDTIQLKPQVMSYYLELLNIYQQQGRYQEAIPYYQKALKVTPDDDRLLLNLINSYFNVRQYDKALPYINKAIELDQGSLELYFKKAQAYFYLHQSGPEKAVYQRILKIQPNNLQAMNNLAQLYLDARQLDEAMELFKRAQAISPDEGRFDRNLGVISVLKGQYLEGREWLTKAVSKNPNDYLAYRFLGDTYYAADQYMDAIKYYQKSLSIKKDYYKALYPLGKAYYYSGNLTQAKAYFVAYSKRYPKDENCQFFLRRLNWILTQKAPKFKVYPATP